MDRAALGQRYVLAIAAMALVASACGDGDASTSTAPPEAPTTIAFDTEAYCDSLEAMLTAQPADFFFGDEFGEAMTAYADAIDATTELAPDDQKGPLRDLAGFVRDVAMNQTDDGMLERAFMLAGRMLPVQDYAEDECGLDTEALAGGGASESLPPIRDDVSEIGTDVISAVNGLVPAGVELAFESFITTDDEEYPVLLPAPVGWEARDFIGTSFEPGDDLGFFTQMDVGAHCDGICAPRDWGSHVGDGEFGPFSGLADATEVLRDAELTNPEGRVVAYREDTTIAPVKVIVARWDDRADRYFRCEAKLDEDDIDLWEVFVAACEAAIPLWIPAG